jgi:hypothetical protein
VQERKERKRLGTPKWSVTFLLKTCAPLCTISCVHQVGMLDDLRERPLEMLPQFLSATDGAVRALGWTFLNPATRQIFKKAALWVLGAT